MYNVVEKLNSKPRRPLTMAFQKSEYKQEYEDIESELAYEMDRPYRAENNSYLIQDEKYNENTKLINDGNVKPIVPPRKPIDPSQAGVFNLLDPYMTTYNKEHKKWTPDQWKGIGKKDAITIYDTEEAPKARGFGTKTNPLPNDEIQRNNLPMRDEIWFKTEAKQRQVWNPPKMVPHTGCKSEMKDNYVMPSDVKAKEAKLCPITTPFVLPSKFK
jgi:hypothetical protein